MRALEKIRRKRLEKAQAIRSAGINPYPSSTKRTHTIGQVLKGFDQFLRTQKWLVVAGRIRAQRGHGGLLFLDIQDGSGKIQAVLREDRLGKKGLQFFKDNLDIGDFVEIRGTALETKTREESILADDYNILSKSLLPLPEKWHGLQDQEQRLRKRYLDIMFNPEVKDMIEKRAVFWDSVRRFLKERGFLEVETPVLETTPGGADAEPFKTHHNALDIDLFLRISMGELWQKRLMVAGFEKTFEIGRQFRNEGMDPEHLQDYTQMEFYWAYADYKKGMDLVQELYRYLAQETFHTLQFKIKGSEIDLAKDWQRYDFNSEVKHGTGIDVLSDGLKKIKKKLDQLKIEYNKETLNRARGVDMLWKYCRKKIAGPGFLINVPVIVSPLAKQSSKHPRLTERFQVIVAGSEVGNGYSELNDPLEQARRFQRQQELRNRGDVEAQRYDKDYVEALEYGMPPCCGFGMSERLFSFLMDKPARECQIFPLMRPENRN